MMFGVGVSQEFRILLFFFIFFLYIYVSCRDQLLQLGKRKSYLFCYYLLASIMWFLFGGFSSSSWCLGWAALFYSSTPLAFI